MQPSSGASEPEALWAQQPGVLGAPPRRVLAAPPHFQNLHHGVLARLSVHLQAFNVKASSDTLILQLRAPSEARKFILKRSGLDRPVFCRDKLFRNMPDPAPCAVCSFFAGASLGDIRTHLRRAQVRDIHLGITFRSNPTAPLEACAAPERLTTLRGTIKSEWATWGKDRSGMQIKCQVVA